MHIMHTDYCVIQEIARGLQSLLDIPEEDSQKIQDMMLTFEVSHADMFGDQAYHELQENGKNIPITKENRQVGFHVLCM